MSEQTSAGFNHLDGPSRSERWARDVLHGALAAHINNFGAATTEELAGRFGWFWVRLTYSETEQLVQSALNFKVLTELDQPHDASGHPIETPKWTTAGKAEVKSYPRAGSLTDLIGIVRDDGWKAIGQGRAVWELLALVGGGLGLVVAKKTGSWIVYAIVGVLLGTLLVAGVRNERKLAAAMESWPRMRSRHQAYAAWQKSWPRTLAEPAMILWIYATLVVALNIAIWPYAVSLAVLGLAWMVPVWLWVHAWAKRWWGEIHSVADDA